MEAIKTVNLTKAYGRSVAVDSLNLQIRQGELFSLLGTNGAGKTTTVKLLSGLVKPTDGDAYICGNSITRNPGAAKRLIGVSPQETAIAPNLRVQENLELMCGIHGMSKQARQTRVRELAEQFCLQSILSKKAGKLSGGWQRRLSIAMALISRPSVLFLDEPTLGLDVIARRQLWDMIRTLKGKTTVILTTHYMEEAQALSDRIGILKDGHLLITGTARELMDKAAADTFENAFITLVKEEQP